MANVIKPNIAGVSSINVKSYAYGGSTKTGTAMGIFDYEDIDFSHLDQNLVYPQTPQLTEKGEEFLDKIWQAYSAVGAFVDSVVVSATAGLLEDVTDGLVMAGGVVASKAALGIAWLQDKFGFHDAAERSRMRAQAIEDWTGSYVAYDWSEAVYDEIVKMRGYDEAAAYGFAHTAGNIAGSFVGYTALTIATGGAGAGVMAGVGAASAAGNSAQKALQNGATFDQAAIAAGVAGAVGAASGGAMSKLGAAARGATSLGQVAGLTAAGAGVGAVTPTANFAAEYLTYGKDQYGLSAEGAEQYFKESGAGVSILMGAGVGAVSTGVQGVKGLSDYHKYQNLDSLSDAERSAFWERNTKEIFGAKNVKKTTGTSNLVPKYDAAEIRRTNEEAAKETLNNVTAKANRLKEIEGILDDVEPEFAGEAYDDSLGEAYKAEMEQLKSELGKIQGGYNELVHEYHPSESFEKIATDSGVIYGDRYPEGVPGSEQIKLFRSYDHPYRQVNVAGKMFETNLTDDELIKFYNDYFSHGDPNKMISSISEYPADAGVPSDVDFVAIDPNTGRMGIEWGVNDGAVWGTEKTGSTPVGTIFDRDGTASGYNVCSDGKYGSSNSTDNNRALPYASGSQKHTTFEQIKAFNSEDIHDQLVSLKQNDPTYYDSVVKTHRADFKWMYPDTPEGNAAYNARFIESDGVLKVSQLKGGEIAPDFHGSGGAQQYTLPLRTDVLVKLGYLKEI